MENINASNVFQVKDVTDSLPFNIKNYSVKLLKTALFNIPVTANKLSATIKQ